MAGVDLEIVGSNCIFPPGVQYPDIHRINTEVFGHVVQMALKRILRLWGTMTPLGTTGGQVCVDPVHVKFIVIELVGHRQQRAGVVGAGNTEAGIRSAIHLEIGMGHQNLTVLIDSGGDFHLLGMTPAVVGKHLGSIIEHPHRSAGQLGQYGTGEFKSGRLQLATETTTHKSFDDADIANIHAELPGDIILEVVR